MYESTEVPTRHVGKGREGRVVKEASSPLSDQMVLSSYMYTPDPC